MKEVSRSPEQTDRIVKEFVSDPSDTLLGLVGRPGLLKSSALLKYAPAGEKSLLIEGQMTFLEFHIAVVQNCADPEFVREALRRIEEWNDENDERSPSKRAMRIDTSPFAPYIERGYQPLPMLVIDDARQLIDKKASNEYIKVACDTRSKRFPRYSSSSPELNKVGNVKRYGFSGKVAITSNEMKDLRRGGVLDAIEDRGLVVIVNYSKHVIHESAAERYLNGDDIDRLVFEFIENLLDRVLDLSFRTYSNAVSYVRKAIKHGRPWEAELRDILCGIDVQMNRRESARFATARVMTDSQFAADKNLTRRFEEFHRLTGLSYPSFDRWVKKWKAEQLTGLPEVRSVNPDEGDVAKAEGQEPPLLWAAFQSKDHLKPMFWVWATSAMEACEQPGDRDYRLWEGEIPEGAYVEGLAPPGFALAGEAARVRAGQIPPHREFREPPRGNRSQPSDGKPEASEEGLGAIGDPVVEPDPEDGACGDDRVVGSTTARMRDKPRKQNSTGRSQHLLGKPGPVGKTFAVLTEGRGDQPIAIILAQDEASAEEYRLEHYKRLTTRLVPWPGDLPKPTNPWLRKLLVKDIRSKTTRRDQ